MQIGVEDNLCNTLRASLQWLFMAIDQCGFFKLALRYLNTYFSLTEIAFSLHVHLRMLFQDYQTYIFLKCVCYHIKLDDEKKNEDAQ